MPSIQSSMAEEFLYTSYNGTYEDLLTLYYVYKKLYNTGSANFVQRVVHQYFENYWIDFIEKTHRSPIVPTHIRIDIYSLNSYNIRTEPSYFPSTLYGLDGVYRQYRELSSVLETFKNSYNYKNNRVSDVNNYKN